MRLTGPQIIKIAERANRSAKSVERVYRNERVNAYTEKAVTEAAASLGIPAPSAVRPENPPKP